MVFIPLQLHSPKVSPHLHKFITLSLLLLLAGCAPTTDGTVLQPWWLAIILLVVLAAGGLLYRWQLQKASAQHDHAQHHFDQRYRRLFDNALDCMLITNDYGRYVDANPAACNVLGYSREELLSKHIWDIDTVDGKEAVQAAYDQFIQAGTMLGESTLRGRDGRLVKTEFRAVANFAPGLHLISFRDVTKRKAAEAQLRENEEKFRTLFELLPDALYVADAEKGTIVDANPAAVALVGKSHDELISMHQTALHPPEQLKLAQKTFTRRASNPNTYQTPLVEIDLLTDNGRRTVEIRGRKFITEGTEYVLGVFRDISERKQAEAKLRESEERYRLLFENAGLGIVYCTPTGEILACNSMATRYFKSDPEDLTGRLFSEIYPGSESEMVMAKIETAVTTQQKKTYQTELDLPAGRHYFLSTYSPIFDSEKTIAGVQVIIHDITERINSIQALQLSEKMLRVTLDAIQETVFLISASGTIIECNQIALERSGKTRQELLGSSIFTFVDETVLVDDADFQQLTLSADKPYTVSVRQHGRIYECTVYPILADDNQISHAAIYAQDVTEQIATEKERTQLLKRIKRQSQLVSNILNSLPEGVILLNSQQHLVKVNPAARALLQQLNVAPDDGATLTHLGPLAIDILLEQESVEPIEQEFSVANQSFLVTTQQLAQMTTPDRSGWIFLLKDITTQKEQEQMRQQQERLVAVGQLAAGIAHDFNNILAVIVLYTEMMLMEKWLPDQMTSRLKTILTQTEKATTLVQQIVDFGRRSIMNKESLVVLPFIKKTVALLRRILPENITISLTCDDDAITIKADARRLEQLVINMALNASDAMPEGGRLDISLARWQQKETRPLSPSHSLRRGEWLQMTISDNGNGIEPEIQSRIFEPFFTTRAPLGHGLGLSQVYGIVKQHGGEINLYSTPGEGTTFTIYLPTLTTPSPPDSETNPLSDDVDNGRSETILIIEDDEPALETIADILRALNYRVLTARNGRDGLDRYHEHQTEIDLVLSDMVMPHLGGAELFYALRAEDPNLKVILFTGYSQRQLLESLVEDGLNGWLEKPPRLEELSTLVARVLEDKKE